MDRRELRDALLTAGLSPEAFEVEGVHEHASVPTDFWFLRRSSGGGWEVGAYERGRYDVRQVFASEQEAAALLWRALTGRPAPP
ncbi:hypothetical protein V6V47_04950 [Micromonospora sp. CPCC 205539]|uniref:hypothetical protein n=1 Tax=Micromonospora sp. CPCC 205539 TaxID=3122408 RepID=UPI002FEF94A2